MHNTTVSQNVVTSLDDSADEFSALSVVTFLLQSWRWIVIPGLVLGLALSLPTLLKKRVYKSTSRFILQSQNTLQMGGLGGVAAQFGLTLPGMDMTQSPDFYADMATSRTMLGQIVDTRYTVHDDDGTHTGTLVDLLDVDGKTPALRSEAAIDKLKEILKADVDRKVGTVDVDVITRWPELSRDVNARALQLVNSFNVRIRQSSAANELRFTEDRLAEAGVALRTAEQRLEEFMQTNRQALSPNLTLENQRLQREVSLQQSLYVTLAQNADQARLSAEHDTPVITVLEDANYPVRPESRKTILGGLLGLFLGSVIGLTYAYMRSSFLALAEHRPDDVAAFRAAISLRSGS